MSCRIYLDLETQIVTFERTEILPTMIGAIPTGGFVCRTPVAWVPSNNYLAVPFSRLLHIYNATATPPIKIATANAHQDVITGVLGLPQMQFVSSSLDATLRFWDVLDGHCVRTVDLARPIRAICHAPDSIICVTDKAVIQESVNPKVRRKTLVWLRIKRFTRVAAAQDASIIAVISGNRLYLTALSERFSLASIRFSGLLSAVAVSSDGSVVAVADISGKIYLIKNPSSHFYDPMAHNLTFEKILPTIFHWHASGVKSLSFVHEDSVLLSAGQEAVLVSWTVTPLNFGEKTFLPRLSAPILALSVSGDESLYAISHSDNSVSLVNQMTGTTTFVIRSIGGTISLSKDVKFGDEAVRSSMSVCDAGGGGRIYIANDNTCIQEFNAIKGEHLRNIDIVPVNETYNASDKALYSTSAYRVTHVAMHPQGNYLATTDVMKRWIVTNAKSKARSEVVYTLRIWERSEEDNWVLATVVTNPHGDEKQVLSVTFHPVLKVLLTTGADHKFIFWRATDYVRTKTKLFSIPRWRSELTGSYREQLCRCASFSTDGTLVAIGCGSVLTLWEVADCLKQDTNGDRLVSFDAACSLDLHLSQALVHAPSHDYIQSVKFAMSDVALFIASTANGVYAWNAVSHGIWWSCAVGCEPCMLAVDSESGHFAVVVQIASLVAEKNGPESEENISDEKGLKDSSTSNSVDRELMNESCEAPEKFVSSDAQTESTKRNTEWDDHVMTPERSSQKFDNSVKGMESGTDRASTPRRKNEKSGGKISKREKEGKSSNHLREKKHEREGKLQKREGTPHKREVLNTDYAVAIFDASSPVPIRVNRLPSNVSVMGLVYVNTEKSTVKDTNGGSTLICIDSNFEISMMQRNGETDELSLVSDEPLGPRGPSSIEEPMGQLDMLLGESWQQEPARDTMKEAGGLDDTLGGDVALQKAFADHFVGPVHAQAPVSTQSFGFMMTVLRQQNGKLKIGNKFICHADSKELTQASELNNARSKNVLDKPSVAESPMDIKKMLNYSMKIVKKSLEREKAT